MAMVTGTAKMSFSSGQLAVTGDGMAKSIADALAEGTAGRVARTADTQLGRQVAAFYGELATDIARGVVAYIQAEAKAHVTSEALGRVPNPATPGAPIAAPAAPVDVPIV